MRPQRERRDAIKKLGWYFYLELVRLAGFPSFGDGSYHLHEAWLKEMLPRKRIRKWVYRYKDGLWHCSKAGQPIKLSFPQVDEPLQFRFKRKRGVWTAREALVVRDALWRLEQPS